MKYCLYEQELECYLCINTIPNGRWSTRGNVIYLGCNVVGEWVDEFEYDNVPTEQMFWDNDELDHTELYDRVWDIVVDVDEEDIDVLLPDEVMDVYCRASYGDEYGLADVILVPVVGRTPMIERGVPYEDVMLNGLDEYYGN